MREAASTPSRDETARVESGKSPGRPATTAVAVAVAAAVDTAVAMAPAMAVAMAEGAVAAAGTDWLWPL